MAAKPSLEDLLKDVPPEKLDEPCRDDHLSELALSVTEWQSIAPFLGLSEAEEEDIERDCAKNKTQKIKMLRKWKEKFGKRATYRRLARVFWKLGRVDLVGELCDILQMEGGPPDSKKVGRDALKTYADYLRERYQTDIPSFFTLQWPPPPTRKVFNLAMIHEEPLRRGPVNEELVRLMLKGRVNDVMQRKSAIELEDLFKPAVHGKKRQVVLIEGAPGAGKSTLAWHICEKWESGELFQEFEVTIFVQLRDPAIQCAKSIADILPTKSNTMCSEVLSIMEARDGRGVLFVLDGWDEYSPGLRANTIFRKLITKPNDLSMHLSALVITSRPIASGAVQPYVSSRVEIVGFTPVELKKYFKEALQCRGPHMVERLQQQLSIRPVIQASCYLPLNAAIVAHLFIDLKETLPTTLHEVFTTLVLCCIIRHLKRLAQEDEIPDISSLDDLPTDIQKAFDNICSLAYRGVNENKVTFSEEEFIPSSESATLSLIQGIQCFRTLRPIRTYNFIHLSIQELLAAFHISKMSSSEQVWIFKGLFNNPRFATVFQFYAAFTKLQTEGIREIVAKIAYELDMNHDSQQTQEQMTSYISLLHCLYEAQDLSLCQFVASRMRERSFDLRKFPVLSQLDYLVVGYFLSCVCLSAEFTIDTTSADDNSVCSLLRELSRCCSDPCGCLNVIAPITPPTAKLINCPAVKKMTLVSLEERDSVFGYISQGLKVNRTLKKLHVSKCGITEKGTKCLADALTANGSLEVLELKQNTIGDSGIACISKSLKVNRTLKKLHVSKCGITEKGTKCLADALTANGSLEVLELKQNTIGDSGIACISKSLKVNRTLKKLHVSKCGITEKGTKCLADALTANDSLEVLDLRQNTIGDSGIACISKSLKVNRTLKKLHVPECGITEKGTQCLADALTANDSLEVLDLRQNTTGDSGIACISKSLKVNHTLRKLHVPECGITEKGTQCLADALTANDSLEVLDLRKNTIGDSGIACISKSLKVNCTLKKLHVPECGITENGADYLGDVLRRNACKSLESLDLGWNSMHGTGVTCLFRSLRENDTLRMLSIRGGYMGYMYMGYMYMGDTRPDSLVGVLEVNKSLEVLYMDDWFTEQGLVSLSNSLQKNKHLRELHLYSQYSRDLDMDSALGYNRTEEAWKQFVLGLQNCLLTKIIINSGYLFSEVQKEGQVETVNQARKQNGLPLLSLELHVKDDQWLLQ